MQTSLAGAGAGTKRDDLEFVGVGRRGSAGRRRLTRVDDELIAVGGKHGERHPERGRALAVTGPIARTDRSEHRYTAIVGQPEESGLIVVRRSDQDPITIPNLYQA